MPDSYRRNGRRPVSDDTLSIAVVNNVAAVSRATEQVEAFCAGRGIADAVARKFSLALNETLTNAVSYAFPDGGRHSIAVRIEHRAGYLTATVSDDGAPFDPLSQPAPDIHAPVAERKIGGLGIHLVRSLMETVAYRRRGGRNELTFRIRDGKPSATE
jgi:serine/threonine-protein kinase RsbW/sigma-B regulation protein RsbU (phosphoserine phosphatase)